ADALRQVRSPGPFASRALLDLGWSAVRPATGGADAVRRALVPWLELVGRDPFDPAVQEGLVALPYALYHLGAQAQSAEYSERAVRALESTHEMLERASATANADL